LRHNKALQSIGETGQLVGVDLTGAMLEKAKSIVEKMVGRMFNWFRKTRPNMLFHLA